MHCSKYTWRPVAVVFAALLALIIGITADADDGTFPRAYRSDIGATLTQLRDFNRATTLASKAVQDLVGWMLRPAGGTYSTTGGCVDTGFLCAAGPGFTST